MSRDLYIFDLDGTLADCGHRKHFLDRRDDPRRWRDFYAACGGDAPIPHVIAVMERLRRFADVWIFSGRSDEVLDPTVAWLARHTSFMEHELRNGALTMRRAGDYRPDDELKLEMLESMFDEDRARLVATFDDRDRVVAMWRRAGVPCFQVAPGDF